MIKFVFVFVVIFVKIVVVVKFFEVCDYWMDYLYIFVK